MTDHAAQDWDGELYALAHSMAERGLFVRDDFGEPSRAALDELNTLLTKRLAAQARERPREDGERIVRQHRREVELSPGVGHEVQRYALALCDDILSDLARPAPASPERSEPQAGATGQGEVNPTCQPVSARREVVAATDALPHDPDFTTEADERAARERVVEAARKWKAAVDDPTRATRGKDVMDAEVEMYQLVAALPPAPPKEEAR